MNAFVRMLEDEYGPVEAEPLGRVVGISGRRLLIASLGENRGEASDLGGLVVTEGLTPAIAVVRGFEMPTGGGEAGLDNVVVTEAEQIGYLDEDGRYRAGPMAAGLGASVRPFRTTDLLEHRRADMRYAVPVGTAGEGLPVHLDADQLFRDGLVVAGETASGKSSSLAVVIRSILRERVPARVVLLDTEGVMGRCFGSAAEVIDCSRGILPPGLLSTGELQSALEAGREPLGEAERGALAAVRSEAKTRGARLPHFIDAAEDIGTRDLARRFRDVSRDLEASAVFGPRAEELSSDDVLQLIFRLPVGQPPMAVLQLHHVPAPLRQVIVDVLTRLAASVVEVSAGAIPVLVAVDGAETIECRGLEEVSSRLEGFGLARTVPEAKEARGLVLLHRSTGAEQAAERLEPGEALLFDPSLPGTVSLGMTQLPERSLPTRIERREPPPRETLLAEIADAWNGASR